MDSSFVLSFEGFGIAATRALLQTFGILRWHKQEEKKPHNHDFKAALAWMISSGHIESGPGALPSLVFYRAAANSAAVKSRETLIGVAVGVLQWSDTFLGTSLVD